MTYCIYMNTISPIDGRYKKDTEILQSYFTESSLIHERYIIEIEYLLMLLRMDTRNFPYDSDLDDLLCLYTKVDSDSLYRDVKKHEEITNHDVKSIEYLICDLLVRNGYTNYCNLIHFGLTSQDVNTTAYSNLLRRWNKKFIELIEYNIYQPLLLISECWRNDIIVGRTHGQPATWTSLGKEMYVYVVRIKEELNKLALFEFTTKMGGSVGNLTSHKILCSKTNWSDKMNNFCKDKFNLRREHTTTQIHNYNNYSEYFDIVKRICGTLKDLCVDMWLYISNNNITITKPNTQIGSSIMPHKVNPIEFETAEGNLKIAIMWCNFISSELLSSRLQRDLTDSTILRNIGVIFGHILISIARINTGIGYLKPNKFFNDKQLETHLYCMSEIENHEERVRNNNQGYQYVKNNKNISHSVEEYKKMILDNLFT
jgi:adenylosuccinate lyase